MKVLDMTEEGKITPPLGCREKTRLRMLTKVIMKKQRTEEEAQT